MSSAGQRIRDLRKAKGLTQPQLAAPIGINQSTLSDIERGAGFSAEILMRLSEELDAPPDFIMRGKSASWPFRIGMGRFLALSPKDRAYVDGALATAIGVLENSITSIKDEVPLTPLHDDRVSLRTGATAPKTSTLLNARVGGSNRAGSTASGLSKPRRGERAKGPAKRG